MDLRKIRPQSMTTLYTLTEKSLSGFVPSSISAGGRGLAPGVRSSRTNSEFVSLLSQHRGVLLHQETLI